MDAHVIQCPYCGEQIEVLVDYSIRRQEYVEDCQVCCKPMRLSIKINDGRGAQIDARPETE
ncbi:MAG: CPXCG motif-containing cysteine-rich protein [Acidobacteria bacterium]|nr:CPXCG motif-containing cysteine-rich protein [Acidobacteriota bacterium]